MTSIISTLLIILLKIPFINILGDKGIGYYSTALIIYLLLTTLISYGLPTAISEHVSNYGSKGQYKQVYLTIKSSFLLVGITGLLSSLILYLGADFIAVNVIRAEYCAPAIRGFAPAILFSGLLASLHGICIGIRKVMVSKQSHILEEVLVAVLCLITVIIYTRISTIPDASLNSMYAAFGYTAGVLIVCIYMFVFYIKNRKRLKRLAFKNKGNINVKQIDILKSLVVSMLPVALTLVIFHASNFIDYAIFNRIMSVQGHKENSYVILLGMLNGKYELFISIPLIIIYKFSLSRFHEIKNVIKNTDNKKINIKINQFIRQNMIFIIPCIVTYVVYAKPLMNLLFTGINDTPSVLLRIGAFSILFYSLAMISNSILNTAEQWKTVVKNALISVLVQVICLLIMMVIFEWGIIAVVISRIIFSASLCVLNEHSLRELTGHILERTKTFSIPFIASIIMNVISYIVFIILGIFMEDKFSVIFAIPFGVVAYLISMVFLGGITQREMYRLPGGKYLAPLCRKLHFLH